MFVFVCLGGKRHVTKFILLSFREISLSSVHQLIDFIHRQTRYLGT